jgi:sialic acid synthase SpsE
LRTLILDLGSGETCQNDTKTMCRMVDAVADLKRHGLNILLKWQLFESVPAGVAPLDRELYSHAVRYADHRGLMTAASVFDLPSLRYAAAFDPPWVKIACRPNLYWMHIYTDKPVLMSVESAHDFAEWAVKLGDRCAGLLCCVPAYPAPIGSYERFGHLLRYGISDHTEPTHFGDSGGYRADMAQRWRPAIYECHFALHDSTGPDAGEFSRRPEDVQAVIEALADG